MEFACYFTLILITCWPTLSSTNRTCVDLGKRSYGKYLGCFEDHDEKRMFRGYLIYSTDKNNIEICINTCLSHRFVYAGMQYSYGCYCGNTAPKPGSHAQVSNDKCDSECASNPKEFCGGYGYMSVYETGITQILINEDGEIVTESNTISEISWRVHVLMKDLLP